MSEKSERLRRRSQITVWQSGWSAGKQLQSLSHLIMAVGKTSNFCFAFWVSSFFRIQGRGIGLSFPAGPPLVEAAAASLQAALANARSLCRCCLGCSVLTVLQECMQLFQFV